MTEPIVLGLLTVGGGFPGTAGPQEVAVAEAAVQFVNNDRGGVDGRPIELLVEEEQADPERAAAAATSFVAAGVSVVFGLGVVWADAGLPILEEASLPWMGAAVNPREFTSPVSFPVIGGVPAEFAALARYFAESVGTRRFSVLSPDLPPADDAVDLLAAMLAGRGAEIVGRVPVALDAVDMEDALTQGLAASPDVVVPFLGGAQAVSVMRASGDAGSGVPLAFIGTAMEDDAVFTPAGDAAEGTLHCAEFLPYDDPSDPEVREFHEALARYSDFPPTSWAQGSFGSVVTIADVLATTGPDPADVLAYLTDVDGQSVYMASSMSRSHAPDDFPQLTNVDCLMLERRDGRLVDVGGGWINGWS